MSKARQGRTGRGSKSSCQKGLRAHAGASPHLPAVVMVEQPRGPVVVVAWLELSALLQQRHEALLGSNLALARLLTLSSTPRLRAQQTVWVTT